MLCKKCNSFHDGRYGSGIFCSSNCARSFSTLKDNKNEKKDSICCNCGINIKINKRAGNKTTQCTSCKNMKKNK